MFKNISIVSLGALSYGMLSSFAKIAYNQGYTAGEITFTQALLGAALLWSAVIFSNLKRGAFSFSGNWKLLLAGTSMGVTAYFYYLSVKYIPASLAIVLLMQMTWMSILAEWLVYKKKPSTAELVSCLLILTGTVIAGNLTTINYVNFPIIGILLGLTSALLYTLYVLFTSKLGNDVPKLEKSALMTTGSALMIFLINFQSISTSSHLDLGLLQWGTFLAVFGTVIPPICFTWGMPKIGASLSSILLTLELPAAIFCAHLILNEQISIVQILGVFLMLSAIIFLNITKAKRAKLPKTVNQLG